MDLINSIIDFASIAVMAFGAAIAFSGMQLNRKKE